jgi:uncharacterized protein YegL
MLRNLNDDSVESLKGAGGFNFSATKLENLLASEYTLVDIVVDVSGSVNSFKDDLEKCVQEIVKACSKSPRADNLMIRLTEFNPSVNEVHGYKLLTNCNVADYQGIFNPSGGTALFDATYKAIEACVTYGKSLVDNSYTVNGIVFVITDGDDNSSTRSSNMVKDIIAKSRQSESLESIVTVLVGINTSDSSIAQYLSDFNKDSDFSAYVEVQNATANKLAKLADFVSRSISSSSASLGTGVTPQVQSLTI